MNPVLVDFGFVQIYWYSVMIFIGFLLGGYLVLREARRFEIADEFIINLFFYTVQIAIIGARLYYVIFSWDMYSNNLVDIFKIWEGGLAIHGGVFFGLIFLLIYSKKHGHNPLKIMDIASVGLIVGQIIGRWGNFFNQEAHGGIVDPEVLHRIIPFNFIVEGMNIGGVYYHPTFLYESLWCLIGFGVLLFVRRRKYLKTGQIFGLYCMWYSLGRFFLEGMRVEEYNLKIGSFKVAQIVSIGMILSQSISETERTEMLF